MPNYRRYSVPGASVFFTVVTERRAKILGNDLTRDLLRAAFRDCFERWPPFRVDALVMLPEHLHAIWTLSPDDCDFSKRWGAIKKHFTDAWLELGGVERPCSDSRIRHRRRGVWQRGFWDHVLRDERDYQRHFDYIHYNPVKHGLVERPCDWPYSSFHRWIKRGIYDPHWCCPNTGPLDFSDLTDTVGEYI